MERNKALSRSILLDPVNDRIEQLRYDHHKDSLSKISHRMLTHPITFNAHSHHHFLEQI